MWSECAAGGFVFCVCVLVMCGCERRELNVE